MAVRSLQTLGHLRRFREFQKWWHCSVQLICVSFDSDVLRDGSAQSYRSLLRENYGMGCTMTFSTCSEPSFRSICSSGSSYGNMKFGNLSHNCPASESCSSIAGARLLSTAVKAPPQMRQMGAVKVSMVSPGIIYEPYEPREPISFWRRWFTRHGWRRTKEDLIMELKNAYAVAKLRKIAGYSKRKFYEEAVKLYKEINIMIANGDKTSLRKAVTEKMYSNLKNEIKQRESVWSAVHWELIEPIVKIRTLRARMIGIDKNDLNKAFIQLTLEFLAKQKFEAYDSNGTVVAGDKSKEVLVRDIWVFERSLFHAGAYWRLCGRISLK